MLQIRGAASTSAGPLFGGIGPPLGRGRVAAERLHPGPQHGHRRVLLDKVVVVEPVKPSLDGGQPPAPIDRNGRLLDGSGDQVGVAGVHGIADRGFGQPLVLAPSGRPEGQLARQLGLGALQLPPQQLPEQRVVALSSLWDDAVRFLVRFPGSDAAVRSAAVPSRG